MDFTANSEAPRHFHLWTGVWAISAALGRNVWIEEEGFMWLPNLYVVLVGKPGTFKKSTTIGFAKRLLSYLDNINFGPDTVTYERLVTLLSKLSQTADPMKGEVRATLALMISELSDFLKMDNPDLVSFMTSIWDGTSFRRETHIRGTELIENSCVSLIGGTTPNWVRTNFTLDTAGGGLSARTIFVLGKQKAKTIAYPSRQRKIAIAEELEADLATDLKEIHAMEGAMSLTEEAYAWGEQWYDEHENFPERRFLKGEQFEHYYGRKQVSLHKIAMCLSAAGSSSHLIEQKHMESALAMLLQMERSYGEVMEYAAASNGYSYAKMHIVQKIREAAVPTTKRELYSSVATWISYGDFERILRDVRSGSLIDSTIRDGKEYYGSPAQATLPGLADDLSVPGITNRRSAPPRGDISPVVHPTPSVEYFFDASEGFDE
jgi:hypothetical protein